jgi:hypothetical protein
MLRNGDRSEWAGPVEDECAVSAFRIQGLAPPGKRKCRVPRGPAESRDMRKAIVWVALVAFLSYSVFFPPRKAARLDPIEALRHE